jgi:hypothetical protein
VADFADGEWEPPAVHRCGQAVERGAGVALYHDALLLAERVVPDDLLGTLHLAGSGYIFIEALTDIKILTLRRRLLNSSQATA